MSKTVLEIKGIKYNGSNFVVGVPARDLTVEEWAALDESQRTACLDGGTYSVVKKDGE